MADAYFQPIADAVETILQANFQDELDLIDSTLSAPDTDAYTQYLPEFIERFPWCAIIPFGPSNVDSRYETTGTIEIRWSVAVIIFFSSPSREEFMQDQNTYSTAMIKSIVQGSTNNAWELNGEAENMDVIQIDYSPLEEQEGRLNGAVSVTWEIVKVYDPTS